MPLLHCAPPPASSSKGAHRIVSYPQTSAPSTASRAPKIHRLSRKTLSHPALPFRHPKALVCASQGCTHQHQGCGSICNVRDETRGRSFPNIFHKDSPGHHPSPGCHLPARASPIDTTQNPNSTVLSPEQTSTLALLTHGILNITLAPIYLCD